ncbi:uncharacterized protein LOC111009324 [Momordica charantia]|uniref:Uncharacterized protein LOC111009324 n=1 Tax=Momordica charantia TaxID=3673 RepID=A0A6J1C913_MOMCH|nr:uncharacterized protein LOC111009324 [Momordica charantia]
MEVALEVEDDLFFADLSRQLSLLLMDENEDPLPHPHVSLQAFIGVSKGTGVFIPRSLQPVRKQRRGRYNNNNNNIKGNRQFPITIDVNSQVSSNHSLRPKKG